IRSADFSPARARVVGKSRAAIPPGGSWFFPRAIITREKKYMLGSVSIIILLSLLGLGIAFFYMKRVVAVRLDLGLDKGEAGRLRSIHGAIAEGAMAFLRQEYKVLAIFMLGFALLIALLIDDPHTEGVREGVYTAVSFLFGSLISIVS